MLPRFNVRFLIGIGLIMFGVIGTAAIIIFIGWRFGLFSVPGVAPREGGGVGALPGAEEGRGGQVRGPTEGGLPIERGGETAGQPLGTGYQPVVDDVARGRETRAEAVVEGFPMNIDVSPSGGLSYYNPTDTKFYRVSADGTGKRLLSNESFPGVADVVWAPQGDSAILEYEDGSNVYYDFTTKKSAVLPRDLTAPSFRQDGGALSYKLETGDVRDNWVVVSNVDGTGAKAVQATGDRGMLVDPQWSPDYKVVATYRKPSGIDREEIFFIGMQGENFKSLEVEGSQFSGIWSPDGRRMLYSTVLASAGYIPVVWVADVGGERTGQRQYALGLSTWVDRCAFGADSMTVYCAVPDELPPGAGLVPDAARNIVYSLWRTDLGSGINHRIAVPVEEGLQTVKDVSKLYLTQDSSSLFLETFEKVFRVRLK
ncbi:MAG: hypothetical protein AB1352_00885 [Patescibacteria group bacterium]